MASLTESSRQRVERIAARYPERRSALLPALYVAQEQHGYVTDEAIEDIAGIRGVPAAEVKGVASFYTMYYSRPVGRYVFQVCGTLSCALCGAEEVIRFLESKLEVRAGQTTPDGKFMYEVVECLGACGSAPVMLFGDRYYGNLTLEQLDHLIDELRERPADEPQRVPQLTGVDTQD
jgi:NADH-quinone oxidoreductase subunit E